MLLQIDIGSDAAVLFQSMGDGYGLPTRLKPLLLAELTSAIFCSPELIAPLPRIVVPAISEILYPRMC